VASSFAIHLPGEAAQTYRKTSQKARIKFLENTAHSISKVPRKDQIGPPELTSALMGDLAQRVSVLIDLKGHLALLPSTHREQHYDSHEK
jgi:hypothetical protein